MAYVMDKVGCNQSQDADNNVKGQILKGKPHHVVTNHHNHFVALNGRPVLYGLIIAKKKSELSVLTGGRLGGSHFKY